MITDIKDVDTDSLLGEVVKFKRDAWRLVTLTAVWAAPDQAILLYHFDRDFQLRHLRLAIPGTGCVPSITPVYFAAFMPENEIQDGFGVRFSDLCIDYKGSLFMQPGDAPPPYAQPPAPAKKGSGSPKGDGGEAAVEAP